MKKIYKLICSAGLFFSLTTNVKSQVATTYTFSQSSSPYTAITGGTIIGGPTDDDQGYGNFPIGFSFRYNGVCYNQFGMSSNGAFSFGTGLCNTSYNVLSGATGTHIAVMNYDTQLGSNISSTMTIGSPVVALATTVGIAVGNTVQTGYGFPAGTTITAIGANSFTASTAATSTFTAIRFLNGEMRAQTLGSAPNRTLVAQWTNMRNWGTAEVNQNWNYQLQLIESTQQIRIVYGNYTYPGTSYVYLVGLSGTSTADFNNRTTTTNWSSTTVGGSNAAGCTMGVGITPSLGLTFNWTSNTAVPVIPTVALSVSGSTSACGPISNTLSATGGTTYLWSTGSTSNSITPTSTTTTVYQVQGFNGTCIDTKTVGIIVNAIPTVAVNNGTICSGSSFTISPTGASTYTIQGGSSVVSPSANVSYTVVGTSSAGCISANTATSNITVNASPNLTVSGNTAICGTGTNVLNASGASTYSWNTGATTSSISVSPTVTTNYTVVGTATTGCAATATLSQNVGANPTITVNSGAICAGNSFTITPSGASTYTYSGGSAVVSPTATAAYTVTGTSAAGCTGSPVVSNVTVNALPTVSAASSNTAFICIGSTATLTASGASTYVWNTTATTAVIAVSPTTTTSYTVTGTNSAGCSANAVISQSVNTCTDLKSNFLTLNSNLTVYPNPSNGIFNIELQASTPLSLTTIEVTDVLGRVILTDKVNAGNYQLNLGNNVNGVYFVKATVDGKTKTVKIVKE